MTLGQDNIGKIKLCVGILLIFVLIVVTYFLCSQKENYVSNSKDITVDAIDCVYSGALSGAFFELTGENGPTHEIKVIFADNKISKLNYTYKATFATNKLATDALSEAHGKYNIYMYSTKIDQEDLLPTFSTIGNQNIINLFFDRAVFTMETSVFLFLDNVDFEKFQNFTIDQVKQFYEDKGMTCQLFNKNKELKQ